MYISRPENIVTGNIHSMHRASVILPGTIMRLNGAHQTHRSSPFVWTDMPRAVPHDPLSSLVTTNTNALVTSTFTACERCPSASDCKNAGNSPTIHRTHKKKHKSGASLEKHQASDTQTPLTLSSGSSSSESDVSDEDSETELQRTTHKSSEVDKSRKKKRRRCWEGYEPVPGKTPYAPGSCRPVNRD